VLRALLALLILGAAEIYLLLRMGAALGAGATFGILVGAAVVGYVAARAQGLAVLRRWCDATAAGATPEEGLTDGFLVLLGGVLLALPGPISDGLGVLLLIPPVRRRVTARIRRRTAAWVASGAVKVGTVDVRTVWPDDPGARIDFDPRAAAPREVIDTEGHAVEDRPERLLGPAADEAGSPSRRGA
jgi:UPF0716 protein FxsA